MLKHVTFNDWYLQANSKWKMIVQHLVSIWEQDFAVEKFDFNQIYLLKS
jgi:hypothetical protein